MADPWFNPNTFGAWYGGLGGGIGGTLCGLLGGLAGYFAPRGKGRRWIIGGMVAFLAFGLVNLGLGLAALAMGQPYGIWYPMTLLGAIFTVVIGVNIPAIRGTYRRAEERRMGAEDLRNR